MEKPNCTIYIKSGNESVVIVPILKKPARYRRVRFRQILKTLHKKNDSYSYRLFSKVNTHEEFKLGNLQVIITKAFQADNALNSGQVAIKADSVEHFENCSIVVNNTKYKFSDLVLLAPLIGLQYTHLKNDYLHMIDIDNITIEVNRECKLIFIRFNMETEFGGGFNYTWGVIE